MTAGATPLVVTVGLAYFAVCAVIGVAAARRTRTPADFFAAGRGLGVVTLALSSMAATLSGFAFVGGPALVYRVGFGAVFLVLPASITATLTAWVLGRPLRALAVRHGVLTLPEALGTRYGSPRVHAASAIALLIAVIGYVATNLLALGLALDAIFGCGLAAGVALGTAATVAYTATGGILAGVWTDVFQGLLMALASAAVFVVAAGVGGGPAVLIRAIAAESPAWVGPWGTVGATTALSWFFVFGIGTLGQPHVLHKFFMMRDDRVLRWYPALMTGALGVTLLLYVGVGLAMRGLVALGLESAPVRPDDVTPTFLLRHVPPLLAALVFSGVAAAIMSTVNAFLNVGAAALTHDLPRAAGRPLSRPLAAGRLATVALALAAAGVALWSDALVAFLAIFGWGLFASVFTPALAIGLHWPAASARAALASIGTGVTLTLGLESLAALRVAALPAGVPVAGISLVASTAVFLAVGALDARGEVARD